MELQDNYNLLQTNVISKLRDYPRFLCLLKAFANRFDNLQDCVNYLSDMLDVDKAEGIWLDYIAWLVGTNRSSYNILNFFCLNALHLNVEKEFYFEGITPDSRGNLQDVLLRKRIKAKIAYNTSKATRNENIRIIQDVFNADRVIIRKKRIYDNFTIIGSPIIDENGIASNFSINNYLTSSVSLDGNIIKLKSIVNPTNMSNTSASIINTSYLGVYEQNGYIISYVKDDSNHNDTLMSSARIIGANPNLTTVEVIYNNNTHTMTINLYNTATGALRFTQSKTNSNNIVIPSTTATVRVGYDANNNTTIISNQDLNNIWIYIDDKLVYVPYTEEPMVLDVILYGDEIIYPSVGSIRDSINNILGNGVGLRNLEIHEANDI